LFIKMLLNMFLYLKYCAVPPIQLSGISDGALVSPTIIDFQPTFLAKKQVAHFMQLEVFYFWFACSCATNALTSC